MDGIKRLQRNAILRARDTYDYRFTERIFGSTALTLDEEPELYPGDPSPLGRRRSRGAPRRAAAGDVELTADDGIRAVDGPLPCSSGGWEREIRPYGVQTVT